MNNIQNFLNLFDLIRIDDLTAIKLAIDHYKEFDINALYDYCGRSLLAVAVAQNHIPIARYFLELGADPNGALEAVSCDIVQVIEITLA